MIVLAIDTSTPRGSLALVDATAAAILGEEAFASARSHNALIFAPLGRLLQAARAHDGVDRVVVGTGPGSYTGIRIGIAAAHGVAAAMGVPWTGWNSLAALDDSPRFHVLGDARRGGFFHAVVEHGRILGTPEIHPLDMLDRCIESLDAPVFTTDPKPLHPAMLARSPSAARLAVLAAGEPLQPGPIEPLYLRAPYITTPKT
jgi:tRNA threonylcarbamoyl adenosine modification protein YeaZ